jgi:hypothetical protein
VRDHPSGRPDGGPGHADGRPEILRQIGAPPTRALARPRLGRLAGGTVTEPTPIFPRLDPDKQAALIAKWTGHAAPAAPARRPRGPAKEITFDDFAEARAARRQGAGRREGPKTEKLSS